MFYFVAGMGAFTGSAGDLVVTLDRALLWTDSRYFIQAAAQLDGSGIELMKDGLAETPSIAAFLCSALPAGSRVGVDGMLFSAPALEALASRLESAGIDLDCHYHCNVCSESTLSRREPTRKRPQHLRL